MSQCVGCVKKDDVVGGTCRNIDFVISSARSRQHDEIFSAIGECRCFHPWTKNHNRIGLRNNPDGSATFEMPDTYPTAGIVLHPDPNSDKNILIGGSAENIRATSGGRALQVQSSNAILNGDCE